MAARGNYLLHSGKYLRLFAAKRPRSMSGGRTFTESCEPYRRVRQAKGWRARAHSHDASACTDGAAPVAGLIADRAGNLYGTTAAGRASKALRRGRSNSHLGVFSHSQAILELRREVIARGQACTVPAALSSSTHCGAVVSVGRGQSR